MLLNGQAADFHVGGSIRPFPNVQRPYPIQSRDVNVVAVFSQHLETLLAVYRHVLGIASGVNQNGIPVPCLINGFLNGHKVA